MSCPIAKAKGTETELDIARDLKKKSHFVLDAREDLGEQTLGDLFARGAVAPEEEDEPDDEPAPERHVKRIVALLVDAHDLHPAHLAVASHADAQFERSLVLVMVEEGREATVRLACHDRGPELPQPEEGRGGPVERRRKQLEHLACRPQDLHPAGAGRWLARCAEQTA